MATLYYHGAEKCSVQFLVEVIISCSRLQFTGNTLNNLNQITQIQRTGLKTPTCMSQRDGYLKDDRGFEFSTDPASRQSGT